MFVFPAHRARSARKGPQCERGPARTAGGTGPARPRSADRTIERLDHAGTCLENGGLGGVGGGKGGWGGGNSTLVAARMPTCGLRGPLLSSAVADPHRNCCWRHTIALLSSCHSHLDAPGPTGLKMGSTLDDPPGSLRCRVVAEFGGPTPLTKAVKIM